MSSLEKRFNAGVDFEDLYEPDVAQRFCVLHALKDCEGHENRISREELVRKATYYWWIYVSKDDKAPGERRVRSIIRELRRNGALICSTGGTKGGYWVPTSLGEVLYFVTTELVNRAMDLLVTAKRMRDAAVRKFGGQLKFWQTEVDPEDLRILDYVD